MVFQPCFGPTSPESERDIVNSFFKVYCAIDTMRTVQNISTNVKLVTIVLQKWGELLEALAYDLSKAMGGTKIFGRGKECQ